ncbi:hypothetical protein GQ600_16073 [Phytophthora cactorum]|nr:hypothetical protein GQ600_16073 [Phytophthora cactorum]
MDVGARKPKKTKRAKGKIARLVAGVPLCDRQTLESLANATAVPKTTLWRHLKKRLASPCGFALNIMKLLIFTDERCPSKVLGAQDEPVAGYFRCRCSRVRQQAHGRGTATSFRTSEASTRLRRSHALCSTRGNGYARAVDPPAQFESVWMAALDGIQPRSNQRGAAPGRHSLRRAARQDDHEIGTARPLWFEAGWLVAQLEHYLAVFVCYELDGQPRCQLLARRPWSNHPAKTSLRKAMSTSFGTCCPKTTVKLSKTASTWLVTIVPRIDALLP